MHKLWPRSLFGLNLLLLLGLALVVMVCSVAVYIQMQRPRVIELGSLVAGQVNTLDSVLSQIAPANRENVIQHINQADQIVVHDQLPPGKRHIPRAPLIQLFVDSIHQELKPNIDYRWLGDTDARLWVNLNIAGQRSWVSLPVSQIPQPHRLLTRGLLLLIIIASVAVLLAFVLQRRLNRPLQQIAAAFHKLELGGRPEKLPEYTTTELALLSHQFNAMVESLDAMESNRAIMLAGISHDIRTPLTKLRLGLEMSNLQGSKELYRYLRQIDTIIDQFLEYGRSGNSEPEFTGDLNVLIQQLAAEFEGRDIMFALVLNPLPETVFQPVAMQRVLRNLMENAVKYAGGNELVITSYSQQHQLYIEVADRGPGISQDKISLMLRPFERGDAARTGVDGTGLGLAIAEALMRRQGGNLQLLPRAGGGLIAQVILPLRNTVQVSRD